MKTNKKLLSLVEHGFKPSTLMKMSDPQIHSLYVRLIESKKESKEATQTTSMTYDPKQKGDAEQLDKMLTGKSYKSAGVDPTTGRVTLNMGKKDIKNKNKVISDTEMKEEINFLKGKKKDEVKEKSVSKQQQKFFGVVSAMQKGDIPKKGKAGKAAKEMSKKDVKDFASTKHKGLPKKKETKESYTGIVANAVAGRYGKSMNDIQLGAKWNSNSMSENIKNMVDKHITPKISKKDFIKYITENAKDSDTKEAPTKPKTKPTTKPNKDPKPDTPYRPKPGPEKAPKAKKHETKEATETAPVKPKPGTKPFTKPGTKPSPRPDTPYRPKPGPEKAPKAGRRDLPDWLSYDSIGLHIK